MHNLRWEIFYFSLLCCLHSLIDIGGIRDRSGSYAILEGEFCSTSEPIGGISLIHLVRQTTHLSLFSLMKFTIPLMICVPRVTCYSWSKSSGIQGDKGYLTFIIALHPLYLNPNDDIVQGSGIQPPQTHLSSEYCILDCSRDPQSKEWALTNSGVTTLMVEPLCKRAQLPSSSILN